MVVMSDAEAFGWKMAVIACIVVIIFILFAKIPKNSPTQSPETVTDTIVINDTIYQNDTITIWKQAKTDTVYIIKNDTI